MEHNIIKQNKKSDNSRVGVAVFRSDTHIEELGLKLRQLQKEFRFGEKSSSYNVLKKEKDKLKRLLRKEMDTENYSAIEEKPDETTNLLLTNGKIDLDKIICLHVLSIEQLDNCEIDQCKKQDKIVPMSNYSNYLPLYLVQNENDKIKCTCWGRDEPIFSDFQQATEVHLQVNCKIENIINSIIGILKSLNSEKLKELSFRAHSVEQVQYVLDKPESQLFLRSLMNSKLIQSNTNTRIEKFTLLQGKPERFTEEISKFKKNLVFRLNVPISLTQINNDMRAQEELFCMEATTSKAQAESSLDQLLQIKKRVNSNISVYPGYQLLQKGSSTGGIAVIDQNGLNVSYLAGETTRTDEDNDLTILMHSPKISHHQYVVQKMSETESDKIVMTKPKTKMEEIFLRMAKREMNTGKKITQDDLNHKGIKDDILKKLSNGERVAVAEKAAKLKNQLVNSGKTKEVPLSELLKGTVERHSLLKLVREASDIERNVLFKPVSQGGMEIGNLLVDSEELGVMSRITNIPNANNVAIISGECSFSSRYEDELNVCVDNPLKILKIEQEVSKNDVTKNYREFINRLKQQTYLTSDSCNTHN